MNELEFYLLRLYVRKGGWRVTIFEIVNFDTNRVWSLLALGWDKEEGMEFEISFKAT